MFFADFLDEKARVINRLSEKNKPVTIEMVETVVLEHLTNDNDDWEMEHFRSRLEIYYPAALTDTNDKPIPAYKITKIILDHMATVTEPQTIDQIWAAVKSSAHLNDRDEIISLLSSLVKDHYLLSNNTKRYTFRFPLIKRWWHFAQGLSK